MSINEYEAVALESIPPSLEALRAVDDCYAPSFIRAFSACTLPSRLEIRRALRAKFKTFRLRDFDALVNEAESELRHAQSDQVGPGWVNSLLTNDRGKALAVIDNALTAFRCAPEWQGVLNFDLSSMDVVVKTAPPWPERRSLPYTWADQDDTAATAWLQREGILLKTRETAEAIQAIAHEHEFHPFRDYLDGLPGWDGQERIDFWLETYIGVRVPVDVSTEEAAIILAYIRDVSAKFLIGAIARAKRPGCKHDTCLILEGPQGIKKSTALSTLFEPWFTDDMPDLHTKDASMQTRGVWLIEFGELDNLNRSEVSRIKAFLSRKVDRFRPPYGRRVIEAQRESVFAGTVNQSTYLRDETGGRRFWPVTCGEIDIPGLKEARPMLWAEALVRYNVPEPCWWINDPDVVRESVRQQQNRFEADAWQDLIRNWLAKPTQRIWGQEGVDPYTTTEESTTLTEVLLHCLGKRPGEISHSDKNRVSQSMQALGWSKRKVGPRPNRQVRHFRTPLSKDSEPK